MPIHYHFEIEPFSINKFRNLHYRKKNEVKKSYSDLVAWQIHAQGVQNLPNPCAIVYEFSWKKKRRRDLENYAITIKFINDTLLPDGMNMLEDDNMDIIRSISIRPGRYMGEKDAVDMFVHKIDK